MIYLNNAATTKKKPSKVFKAVNDFLTNLDVSPGRGSDSESIASDKIVSDARISLAELFNLPDPNRIIFTLNATDSLNMVIKGYVRPGDHVIVSGMEHNSVIRPLRYLESAFDVRVTVVPSDDITKYLTKKTRLVAVLHASNVTGEIYPIADIGGICANAGVAFLADGAQSAGAFPIDLSKINVDFFAFSGHKALMGPQGTGGLYIKKGIDIIPMRHGGTGTQSELEMQPDTYPDKYESGTPNTPGIAGLAEGVKYIITNKENISNKEKALIKMIHEGLDSIKNVKIYGSRDPKNKLPVVSFNIDGMNPKSVSAMLEKDFQIVTRSGLHCSPLAHKSIGTFPLGTVRVSAGYYNTADEIKKLIRAIEYIAKRK